jgi:hypothetical protein
VRVGKVGLGAGTIKHLQITHSETVYFIHLKSYSILSRSCIPVWFIFLSVRYFREKFVFKQFDRYACVHWSLTVVQIHCRHVCFRVGPED